MSQIVAGVTTTLSRQHIQVQGIVQGVGFRPFIYSLAADLGLVGFVRNDGSGVTIEVEGPTPNLEQFAAALVAQAPPLASIDSVTTESIAPCHDECFEIVVSQGGAVRNTLISPDVATCDDCLHEMLDPADRRYGYPFINCTNCGPRFTIVNDIPYDRDKTTMSRFPLCAHCRTEYEDPLNRRFHAQPNACAVCGPHITLTSNNHAQEHGCAALHAAVALLASGKIVAIKGLGGYHLACDASNGSAVDTLRRRKHREVKPFALMAPDLDTIRQFCNVSPSEAELLQSRRRPIVLLRQRLHSAIATQVAPGYNTLGFMLPYTPLHTLLLAHLAKHREATAQASSNRDGDNSPPLNVLVMTSGNISDEPIAFRDSDARQRLATIADAILGHNRDIHTRCDDSLVTVIEGPVADTAVARAGISVSEGRCPVMLRRSRGYVPEPIRMQRPFPLPVLAVGGHLKNTFCLGNDQQAFMSHHIGDLENMETLQSFEEGIDHFIQLFDIQPQLIVHDLHPDYLSTKWALDPSWSTSTIAALRPPIGVQHHHAHIASVLAEHGLDEPVIGVAADGTGYGLDGAVWGGEVLVAGLANFARVAHLTYVPLPGGAQAIRQPWRMAAVYLQNAFGADFLDLDIPFVRDLNPRRWYPLAQMIARGINCPLTSSFGRLFDAVSCLLLGRNEVFYEGQAAIELEMVANPMVDGYPFAISGGPPLQLDVRPVIHAIVREIEQGTDVHLIAGRFHRTVATMLTSVCRRIRAQTGLQKVALSGGVFQNRLLLEQTIALLVESGFQVYINHQVPPNDGGISLGQAAVAAAQCTEQCPE